MAISHSAPTTPQEMKTESVLKWVPNSDLLQLIIEIRSRKVEESSNSQLQRRCHRRPCLAGSCNGILYIQNPNYDAILLNPAMRSSTWIPTDNLDLRPFWGIATGLGYNHTTDDYKAVVITIENNNNIAMTIFSLREKLCKINNLLEDDDVAAKCIFLDSDGRTSTYDHQQSASGTTVGGSPHWTGRRSNGTPALIRFDVVMEEFVDVGLPAELSVQREAQFEFGELDRRLCVTFKGQNFSLEGWSLLGSCWIRLFSFTPKIPFKTLKPVATDQDLLLMVLDRNWFLIKFNINDNSSELICPGLTNGYAHYVDTPTCPWNE